MDSIFIAPANNTLLDKVKNFLNANQAASIVIFEVIFLIILSGSAYAFVTITSNKTAENIVEKTENSESTIGKPDATPTPETTVNTTSDFVDIPEDAPTPTPTNIPNVTMLVYSNSAYNYTINYPIGWTATSSSILDPAIPNYVIFNPPNAQIGARAVAVYITTRSYQAQITLGNANTTPVTVDGITGVQQVLNNSSGIQTTRVILPESNFLYILEGQPPYLNVFQQMLGTFNSTL